jgi:hypothetical protein
MRDLSAEVIALLRGHGIQHRAAQLTVRIGEALRQRTTEMGIEFGALVDDASGRQVGMILSGGVAHIDLGPHVRALEPRRRYLHLHTYPANSTLSDTDLATFLRHPELCTMAVVGRDGAWYVLSKLRGQPSLAEADGLEAWFEAFVALAPRYDAQIEVGLLTPDEALGRHTEETLVQIAPILRLRYDRLG